MIFLISKEKRAWNKWRYRTKCK